MGFGEKVGGRKARLPNGRDFVWSLTAEPCVRTRLSRPIVQMWSVIVTSAERRGEETDSSGWLPPPVRTDCHLTRSCDRVPYVGERRLDMRPPYSHEKGV